MDQTTKVNNFTEGNLGRKMLGFMVPILGSLILITMYSSVDVLVVGRFGTQESISAVSTGSSLINLVVLVLNGLAMGVTILLGSYIGEGKRDKLHTVIGNAFFLFGVIAIVIAVILLSATPFWVQLMQAPEAAFDKTVQYVRICGGGIIFIIGYNLMSSIYRGMGNSRLPLIFVAVACVINLVCDLVFVAVFGWDVRGAASATVMAQGISLILSIVISIRRDYFSGFVLRDLIPTPEIKKIFVRGIPLAVQETLTQISFLALVAFINGMGATEALRLASSSGYGIAARIVMIVMLVPSALMQTLASVVSQNASAGLHDRSRRALRIGISTGVLIGIGIIVVIVFFGVPISSIFSANPEYQLKSAEYLNGFCLEAVVASISFCFIGFFNGYGRTWFVMFQGICQSLAVRLPVAYIMSIRHPESLTYIGSAAPTATCVGIVLNLVFFIVMQRRLARDRE